METGAICTKKQSKEYDIDYVGFPSTSIEDTNSVGMLIRKVVSAAMIWR